MVEQDHQGLDHLDFRYQFDNWKLESNLLPGKTRWLKCRKGWCFIGDLVFPQRYTAHRCDENGVWRNVFLLPCFCEMDTWNSYGCFFVCVLGTTTWHEEIRCCISVPPNPPCFCLRNRSHSAWHIFCHLWFIFAASKFAEQKIPSCSIMGNYMLTHLFFGDSIGRHHPRCLLKEPSPTQTS